MSGLTIYETLRIFLPGALGLLIADVLVRLATGPSATQPADGFPRVITDALESAGGFVVLSTVFGLLLYLIDLPDKLRVADGDPTREICQPSVKFKEIVKAANREQKELYRAPQVNPASSLSLFFLFVDKYLPAELHKRVYLFGALYRIYADARALLMAAVLVGVPVSLAYATYGGRSDYDLEIRERPVLVILLGLLFVAFLGAAGHRSFKHTLTRYKSHNADFEDQRTSPRHLWLPCLTAIAGGSLSIIMAIHLEGTWGYLALIPGSLCWLLWFGFEIGPPKEPSDDAQLRDRVLSKLLRLPETAAPQLPIWFRTATDVALVGPMLVGATMANVYLGRPTGSSAAPWVALWIPAVAIMTVRKHERRLLNAFKDQIAFLEVSEEAIKRVLKSRSGLPDSL